MLAAYSSGPPASRCAFTSSLKSLLLRFKAYIFGSESLDVLLEDIRPVASEIDQSTFAAVIWILHEQLTTPPPARFLSLLQALCTEKLTTKTLLQEHLPIRGYLYTDDGASESQTIVRRLEMRWRTRTWYTQVKFNLFREESQGYARLVALISEESDPLQLRNAVIQLIGVFLLDPNRVVDVVLGEMERRADCLERRSLKSVIELFTPVLQICPRKHVGMILGFRLQKFQERIIVALHGIGNHADEKSGTEKSAGEKPFITQGSPDNLDRGLFAKKKRDSVASVTAPQSLLVLTSALIGEDLVDLDVLFPYLYPENQDDLVKLEKEYYEQLAKNVRSISVVNLTSSKTNDPMQTARAEAVSSGHIIQSSHVRNGPFADPRLQKIQILPMIVRIGGWKLFRKYVSRLGTPTHALDVMAHPPVAFQTAALIATAIDRAVVKRCVVGSRERVGGAQAPGQTESLSKFYMQPLPLNDDLPPPLGLIQSQEEFLGTKGALVREMLRTLGLHARCNFDLLFGLCRLLRGSSDRFAVEILRDVVLPACALSGSNVGLGSALWDTLRELPYASRFALYENLTSVKLKEYPLIKAAFEQTTYDIKQIMKRLSNDNHKRFGRTIAKLTHGSALPVARVMVESVQSYPNLILPLVASLKFISPLSLDMIIFQVLKSLASSQRDKLKQDGRHLAQWYSSSCIFLSALCKKFFSVVDFEPILHFAYNQLIDEDILVVSLVSEVISHVGAVAPLPAMTRTQVLMTGAGPALRALPPDLSLSYVHDAKAAIRASRSASTLRAALRASGLCEAMGVAIAKAKESVFELRRPLKVLSGIKDRVQEVLVQYSSLFDNGIMIGLGPLLKLRVSKGSAFMLERPSLDYMMLIKSSARKASGDAEMADIEENGEPGELSDEGILLDDTSDSNKNIFHEMTELERAFWFNSLKEFGHYEVSDYATIANVYNVERARLDRAERVWSSESEAIGSSIEQRLTARENVKRISGWKMDLKKEFEIYQSRSLGIRERLKNVLSNESASHDTKGTKPFRERDMVNFLHSCIIPRVLLTKADALFSSRFVATLESMSVEQWPLEKYYSLVLSVARGLLFSCSENEADSLALFYSETLSRLEYWRKDAAGEKYMHEVGERWRNGSRVDFHDWCKWLLGIHENLVAEVLRGLQSSEFLELRNILVFLNEVGPSFPRTIKHASSVQKAVEKLVNSSMKDIKLTANSYNARLKAKQQSLLEESSFCHSQKVEPEASLNGMGNIPSSEPGVIPESVKWWNLNPNAPEFIPPSTKANDASVSQRKVRGRGDVKASYSARQFDTSRSQNSGSAADLGKRARAQGVAERPGSGPPAKRSRLDTSESTQKHETGLRQEGVRRAERDPSSAVYRDVDRVSSREVTRIQEQPQEFGKDRRQAQGLGHVPGRSPSRLSDSTDARGWDASSDSGRGHERDREYGRERRRDGIRASFKSEERIREPSSERLRNRTNGGTYTTTQLRDDQQRFAKESARFSNDRPGGDRSGRDGRTSRGTSREYKDSQHSTRQHRVPSGSSSIHLEKVGERGRSPRMSPRDQRHPPRVSVRSSDSERQSYDEDRQQGKGAYSTGPRIPSGPVQTSKPSGGYVGGGRDMSSQRSQKSVGSYGTHERSASGGGYSASNQGGKASGSYGPRVGRGRGYSDRGYGKRPYSGGGDRRR